MAKKTSSEAGASKQKRRRKARPVPAQDKTEYREHQLIKRLLARYTDQAAVWRLLEARTVQEWPNQFNIINAGQICALVTVNWIAIEKAVASLVGGMAEISGRPVSAEELSQVKSRTARTSLLYLLEHLPFVLDAALERTCLEALLALNLTIGGSVRVSDGIYGLSVIERRAIKKRIGIQEGPRPIFNHRSQYEAALDKAIDEVLEEGDEVTQGAVAGKLATERADAAIDDRMIRRWNREFGVNWKERCKRPRKAVKM